MYSCQSSNKVTLLRPSSRATSVQSGKGRSTAATSGVGGNSRRSRVKSSQSRGKGQLSPASSARRRTRRRSSGPAQARRHLPRCQPKPPSSAAGLLGSSASVTSWPASSPPGQDVRRRKIPASSEITQPHPAVFRAIQATFPTQGLKAAAFPSESWPASLGTVAAFRQNIGRNPSEYPSPKCKVTNL